MAHGRKYQKEWSVKMTATEDITLPRILLVDDDQDFLDVYWEFLKTLPGEPDVQTAPNGGRALSLLESERFNLLIVDLSMPRMDGLQVISIARRKYPRLKIVVWTCITDEQFRDRAYGMGVDQYWQKPGSEIERRHFLDSMQSMLAREDQGGFRGVQDKSLVDLIQLECISQNSALLKVNNGPFQGKIWIQGGELIDAVTDELQGEAAFRRILGWKTGSFELLAGDDTRPRAIFNSYQALLLAAAQAMDESSAGTQSNGFYPGHEIPSPLLGLTRFEGVEFALSTAPTPDGETHSWGLEAPDHVSTWVRESLKSFSDLGEHLRLGPVQQVTANNANSHVALADSSKGELCVGFRPGLGSEQVRTTMKNILAKWAV